MPPAPSRPVLASVLSMLVVASAALVAPGAEAADPDPAPQAAGRTASDRDSSDAGLDRPAAVTLVTGDRVTLQPGSGDEPVVLFEARHGGASGAFTAERDEYGVHVIPDDVSHLVPDVLDPDLFNVTRLVEMGYDDATTDTVPLIVQRAPGVRRLDGESLPLDTTGALTSIGATTATVAKSEADDLGDLLASLPPVGPSIAADSLGGATKIHLDGKVEATALDPYLDQVNAPEAWEAGLDGTGVGVAVLDSGIDEGHPALAGQVVAETNFTDEETADDEVGHGTHVASLLAGNGAGADGARQGIAPGAELVSARVLDSENQGLESWVIAGMEWAAFQDVDVVNMSLGGPPAEHDDPVADALEALTRNSGALFVVSAGNRGGLGLVPYSINSPGTAPSALTVGATRPDGVGAGFSSEGPTTGTHLLKPDMGAPGVEILGARAGARDSDLYVPMSGTSMATPLVAGAAALLEQAHPDWTPAQVKARLVSTTDGSKWFTSWENGSGRLDLAAATSQPLVVDRATLDLGYLEHPDDRVKRQRVTLTNTGTEDLTVSVVDALTNDRYTETGELERAPDSAVTAEPATFDVPAGGSAETTISLDPEQLADTIWQGVVRFQVDGQDALRLPIGAYDEPESYDLDVWVVDRNGDPYDAAHAEAHPDARTYVYAMNADTGQKYRMELDSQGRASARVRVGHYNVFAHVATPARDSKPASLTFAGTSDLLVDSDTSYLIDARDGERVRELGVQGQRTRATTAVGFTYRRVSENGQGLTVGAALRPQEVRDGRIFVTPTAAASTGEFEAVMRWQLKPVGKRRPGTPDEYDVVRAAPRLTTALSTNLTRRAVKHMARLDQVLHPVATSGDHALETGNHTTGTPTGWIYRRFVDLPLRRTVLATAGRDVFWRHCLAAEWSNWRGLCRDGRAFPPRSRTKLEVGGAVHASVVETWRSPDTLAVEIGVSDGRRRMKTPPSGLVQRSEIVLETPAGDQLAVADGYSGYFPVPPEQERFRVTHEWELDDSRFAVAPESRTVWEFRAVDGEQPVLLDADYGPALDPTGRAVPRTPLALDLSFEAGVLSLNQAVDRITSANLWVSADHGASWEPLRMRRTSATTFAATVRRGLLRPGAELSLRVAAEDGAGNSVDQTSLGLVPVRRR